MCSKKILSIFVLIFISSFVIAEHDGFEGHDHVNKVKADDVVQASVVQASDVNVIPGEAVIIVHGIVCSFCSQGVIRNLSRLSFIDKSKYTKGVKVEIEVQKVTIAIKADSAFDLKQVFKSIRKGGYEPVEAYISDQQGNITLHKAGELQ